jgi:hypothetical protein
VPLILSGTRVVSGDLARAFVELKSQPGGGARTRSSLMGSIGKRVRLEPLGTRIFESVNVLLAHRPLT